MRKLVVVAAAVVAVILVAVVLGFNPFARKPDAALDTKTHSIEVAGFYGRGDFSGELFGSDVFVSNITEEGNMSQSITFKGAVCQRVPGLGSVFLDGTKSTEPDAIYKVYVNDMLRFTHNMELGSSSPLADCLPLVQKDYVMTGQTTGYVRVELVVYVRDFQRGTGAYEVLAHDQAKLT